MRVLEDDSDNVVQYSSCANLRVHGIPEVRDGDETDTTIIALLNGKMGMDPPLQRHHLERCHRLGCNADDQGRLREGAVARPRPRPIIVRFASERLRDEVYRARTRLKTYNNEHHGQPIYINEDLTSRRAEHGNGEAS